MSSVYVDPQAKFKEVYKGLMWPNFRLYIKIEDVLHAATATYTPCSEATAKSVYRYAVLRVHELGDNVFDSVFVAVGIEGLETETCTEGVTHGLQDKWVGDVPDPSYSGDTVTPRELIKQSLRDLRTMASYINGQLVPKGFRVASVTYVEHSKTKPMEDGGEALFTKITYDDVESYHIPIEEELWEATYHKREKVNVLDYRDGRRFR